MKKPTLVEFSVADETWIPQMAEWWRSGAHKDFHLQDGFSIIAHRAGHLAGYISVVWRNLPPPLAEVEEAFIDFIQVHEDDRRQGIARRLVQMAEGRARGNAVSQIRAWSSEDKTEAIPMWKALGFSLCPADPKDEGARGYYVAKRVD